MNKRLVLALILLAVLATPASLLKAASQSPGPILGKLAIVVVIDGADYRVLDEANLTYLPYLASVGSYTLEAHTVLPSMTTVAHASLACGAYPSVTNVAATSALNATAYREEGLEDKFRYYETINATSIVEVALKEGVKVAAIVGKSKCRVMLGKSGVADVIKVLEEDPYGATITGPDVYKKTFPMTNRYKQDEWIANETIKVIEQFYDSLVKGERLLILVNMPALDWCGHAFGRDSSEYLAVLKNADKQVGRIIEKVEELGLWRNTLLVVLPDHGMENVDPSHRISSDGTSLYLPRIEHVALDAGGKAAYVYLKNLDDMQSAVQYLWDYCQASGVWTRIPVDGANGTLDDIGLNTVFAGDIFVEFKGDWQFYYENEGAHGGVSTQRIFVYFAGWTVKEGYEIESDVSIVDVAPTVSAFLGIPAPPESQGKVLNEIFESPFGSVGLSVEPTIANVGDELVVGVNYTLSEPTQAQLSIMLLDENYAVLDTKNYTISNTSGTFVEKWTMDAEGTVYVYALLLGPQDVVIASAREKALVVRAIEVELPWPQIIAMGVLTVVLGVLLIAGTFKLRRRELQ